MAWIPTLESINEDSGNFTARVLWLNETEGKKSAQEVLLAGVRDRNAFNSILRSNRDNKLDTSIELVKTLSSEIGSELDIEAIPVDPPTQEELDKREYFKQVGKLIQLRQALGSNHIDVIAQEAEVLKLYKLEYYG